jgi:hypothetical protein
VNLFLSMIIYICKVKQSLYFIHLIYLKLFDIRNNSILLLSDLLLTNAFVFLLEIFLNNFVKEK